MATGEVQESFDVPLNEFKDTVDVDDDEEVAEPANLSFGDIDEELEKLSKKSFSAKSRAQILAEDDAEEGHEKGLAGAISFGNIGLA